MCATWCLRPKSCIAIAAFTALTAISERPYAAPAAEHLAVCGTWRWQSFISDASRRTGVPEAWIHAVMRAESAGCSVMQGNRTTSTAGAMGLMQIMPATWSETRLRLALGDDPYDPHDNILAGAAVLRDLYERYGSPGFIAAYHAGRQRFDEYISHGRPLPVETLAYVAEVQSALRHFVAPGAVFVQADNAVRRRPFETAGDPDIATASMLQRTAKDSPFVDRDRSHRRRVE